MSFVFSLSDNRLNILLIEIFDDYYDTLIIQTK